MTTGWVGYLELPYVFGVPAIGALGSVMRQDGDMSDHSDMVGSVGLSGPTVGAIRTFGYFLATGSVGVDLLQGVDYWSTMREEPSLMETALAVFANTLRLDENGTPVNARSAEFRAAQYIREYMTGQAAVPEFDGAEVELHAPFGGSPG